VREELEADLAPISVEPIDIDTQRRTG
jgi:hypothetical protein